MNFVWINATFCLIYKSIIGNKNSLFEFKMSEEALKLNLINRILALKNISLLKKVEASLDEVAQDALIIQRLSQPMRKKQILKC